MINKIQINLGILRLYFTPDFIKKFDISWVDKYPEEDWPFSFFHQCNRFKHEWIEKYPDRDWNYQDISRFHVGLDKLVIKYPDKPWDYSNVGLYCSNLDNLLDKLPDKPGISLYYIEILVFTNLIST